MKPRTSATTAVLAAALLLALFRPAAAVAGEDSSSWWRKPLASRNQFPILLLFLGFEPERAVSLEAGRTSFNLDLSLSNIIKTSRASAAPDSDRLVLDFEWWRFLAQFELGLGRGFQASLSVPMYYRSGGFLDPFISDFHQTFGIANAVREHTPDGLFRYELFLGGRTVLGPISRGLTLGDMVLSVKKTWDLAGTEVGLRAGLKAPSGPWSEAAGSGAWDMGLGVMLSRFARTLGLTLNANYYFLGTPQVPGLVPRDYAALMAGLDLALSSRVALVVQADYLSPFVQSLIPILNRRTAQIATGIRWRAADRVIVEFRLIEDLAAASPDFTFGLRLEFSKGDTIPRPDPSRF